MYEAKCSIRENGGHSFDSRKKEGEIGTVMQQKSPGLECIILNDTTKKHYSLTVYSYAL